MNEYRKYLAKLIPAKDSLKLVKSEAEKYDKSHSLDDCFNMGIELYQSDNFQIQSVQPTKRKSRTRRETKPTKGIVKNVCPLCANPS